MISTVCLVKFVASRRACQHRAVWPIAERWFVLN
jgi:hypothetical protein